MPAESALLLTLACGFTLYAAAVAGRLMAERGTVSRWVEKHIVATVSEDLPI